MSGAYYNEFDAGAAAWLRELIAAELIAPGEVDERSITEVQVDDLRGFGQCHFFAGIGGWSRALRLAGWPDSQPVWTGSCPCQPFSAAGKAEGFDDPRHLWPAWFRLIRECRPAVVFGEQVASKDGRAWFDTVSTDLEATGYAVGAANLCAAGVGAFHIRQRLYFVGMAHAESRDGKIPVRPRGSQQKDTEPRGRGGVERVANADVIRAGTNAEALQTGQSESSSMRRMGNPNEPGPQRRGVRSRDGAGECTVGAASPDGWDPCSGDNFWSDVIWLPCSDGKYRPTKPGIFPLASGVSGRVGLLRGAGNSIVPPLAQAFIEAVMETA